MVVWVYSASLINVQGLGRADAEIMSWGSLPMEITNKRIADIIPYAANAKKHDKRQINNVAESIKQYGFVQPIVIDRKSTRLNSSHH